MKKRTKILIAVLIVFLILAAAAGVFIWHKFSLINTVKLDKEQLQTASEKNATADEPEQEEEELPTGYQMIALVGLDTRDGAGANNSDTMIIAMIDHDTKSIKLVSLYRDTYLNVIQDYYKNPDYYTKANAAYNYGGPEQFLSMLNLNLDLDIEDFITVDFKALTEVIDLMGGLDIDMTREELIHLNNYNVETSEAAGVEYEEIEVPDASVFDGAMQRTFHLTGSQAVSYARIRYTAGYDYRRTARQRLVIEKVLEKAKTMDLSVLNYVLEKALPYVTTNMDGWTIMNLMQNVLTYDVTEETGFPFDHVGQNVGSLDAVIPVTLETNVIKLHEFLFPGQYYTPSSTVKEYSDHIIGDTGLGEESIPEHSESGALPDYDPGYDVENE